MFGKKEKDTTAPVAPITARIETMPGAFYGGADPIIYAGNVAKTHTSETQVIAPPLPPKKVLPPPPPKPVLPVSENTSPTNKPTLQKPPVRPPQKNKMFLVGAIVVLLLLIGGGVYYFFFFSKTPAVENFPSVPTSTPFEASPVVILPTPTASTSFNEILVPTTTPSSTPVVRGGGVLTLPHLSYPSAKDDDADSLTNLEEEIFQTDPEVWDTDNDGYYDGREVANLYNPKGIAPQKIIDSGLVREYINPIYQYRFYYPPSWRVDPVTDDLKDILISANTGDYFEIRVFPKEESVSFQEWFSASLPAESFSSFSLIQNRFQVPFYKSQNNQAAFFETPKAIYSVVYFYGEEEKNAFPHLMEVLMQSFRPTKGGFELPVQPILPGVVSTTPASIVSPSTTLSTSSSEPSVVTTTSSTINSSL